MSVADGFSVLLFLSHDNNMVPATIITGLSVGF